MIQRNPHVQNTDTSRDIDPNVLQGRASNPNNSSWVGASAGSGKTKVLTDRILRLLLPQNDDSKGTEPHKILALTFTKAAASEMELRIQKTLSSWATLNEDKLEKNLTSLLERKPTQNDKDSARRLFAKVIDAQGGLPIMTIHSFCTSVLSRFPLEAGLSPQNKALEELQALELLSKAQQQLIQKAKSDKGSPLSNAISHLTEEQNEEQFSDLFSQIMNERAQLQRTLKDNFGIDGLYTRLCKLLNIQPDITINDLFDNFFNDVPKQHLYKTINILSESKTKTDQGRAQDIKNWLENDNQKNTFINYKKVFLTTENIPRKNIASKKIIENNIHVEKILQAEALRILSFEEQLKSLKCAILTRDVFIIAEELLSLYSLLKEKESALDFDDLILKTVDLLKGRSLGLETGDMAPWVRFKLDQGIDHILVDEAQDTNPEQWEIIQSLCDDFFDGEGAQNTTRTIFVVGDEKQSIFSFQRASPEKFIEIKNWFKEKIDLAQKKFDPVDINISFRTVRSILECVDSVFETLPLHNIKSNHATEHKVFRNGQPGFVELWPLFKTEKQDNINYWAPPIELKESQSGAAQLADHIGETIKSWIDNKETLESHNRPIHAGDIMILMRTRTPFVDQLVRALKTRNIPVSGVDRMVLNDQLIVQDLCAAASFGLLPDDDLTLACLLKSPLIGWNDEDLETIALNRSGTLWSSLKETNHIDLIKWLEELIYFAHRESAFSFFSLILQTPCPATNISGLSAFKKRLGEEIVDPLNEFLNSALSFEQEHSTSLHDFLYHHRNTSSSIKREMEETGNAVRIMTVHGSKGLQSPIVIMPDTIRQSAGKIDKILWPNRSNQMLPLFSTRKQEAPELYLKAQEKVKEGLEQEYKRLLYVAMTRAENRLYIGGCSGKKSPNDESWYFYIQDAFKRLNGVETLNNDVLRYSCTKSDAPDKEKQRKTSTQIKTHDTPKWLHQNMPSEPMPPRPLVPSRPSGNEMPAMSPLKGDDNYRFRRGNLTHMLLQTLPDVASNNWQSSAENYLNKTASDLSKKIKDSIIDETLSILNDYEFAPIFGKDSMAEVPITGLLDDQTLISGQIDRLLVTDTEILIIDFKTNRPPPHLEKDVPQIYKKQMRAYADALCQIYPDREIKTALLWTDGPRLMPLTDL